MQCVYNIVVRLRAGWNTVLLIFLFFSLILLNYFNLVPLSKTFPLLSFLPHIQESQVAKTTITPSPTPLPPITVKKVDTVKGEGEFVINNPTPQVSSLSPEKQIVLDGTYEVNTKKVTIQTSVENSTIPIHPIPPGVNESVSILLSLEMIINDKALYQTNIPLSNLDKTSSLRFKVRVPFCSECVVKIYEGSQELISHVIKL